MRINSLCLWNWVHIKLSCPVLDLEQYPFVYIHFIYGHVKATLWCWLQWENQQQHYRTSHNQKQPPFKKSGKNMEADPPITLASISCVKSENNWFWHRESSNWNETCLNNSLNVSFLAFQITCTVKPDFFLLAGSQRTFCVQGLERRKKKTCEFASFWMIVGLDSRLT